MTAVPEGSRDTGEGIIVSSAMDWCLTPVGGEMVPVPYRIWARQQDVANIVNSVRQTDMRTHARDSLVVRCYGDEAGTGGGVVSGTTGSVCTPETWSSTVRAEGRNVVRHDDEWWMNNKNTYGRLVYVKDAAFYVTAQVEPIEPILATGGGDKSVGATSDEAVDLGESRSSACAVPMSASAIQAAYSSNGVGNPVTTTTSNNLYQQYAFSGPGLGFPTVVAPFPPPSGARRGGGLNPLKPEMRPIVPGYDPKDTFDRELYPKQGNRTSGRCESKRICFDRKSYDWEEYNRQLHLQQDAINAKTPLQNMNDIDNYSEDLRDPSYQKTERDKYILNNKQDYVRKYGSQAWEDHIGSLAALHRLDMVVGGNPADIAGMGNANINSSIGPNWKQSDNILGLGKTRKSQLREYAGKMNKEHCPMAVSLSTCDAVKTLSHPKT